MSRNAFGDLIDHPTSLTRRERIALLRHLAGHFIADRRTDVRWMGEALTSWLRDGGRLDSVLGVTPPRGSRATAQAAVRQAEADALLLRLAVLCGSDRAALAVLNGKEPCPPVAHEAVQRLRELKAPTSRAAISTARKRHRR